MKKTYIIPEVDIHAICVEGLIAASPTPDVTINASDNVNINANSVEVKGNSQSYDVWDDDWQKQ